MTDIFKLKKKKLFFTTAILWVFFIIKNVKPLTVFTGVSPLNIDNSQVDGENLADKIQELEDCCSNTTRIIGEFEEKISRLETALSEVGKYHSFYGSTILTSDADKLALHELLDVEGVSFWKKVYSASETDWGIANYNTYIRNPLVKKTIMLIKSAPSHANDNHVQTWLTQSYIFGGYNPETWIASPPHCDTYTETSEAFLFSFSYVKKYFFKPAYDPYAIRHCSSWLPFFAVDTLRTLPSATASDPFIGGNENWSNEWSTAHIDKSPGGCVVGPTSHCDSTRVWFRMEDFEFFEGF